MSLAILDPPAADPAPSDATPHSELPTPHSDHRGNGKIARLPKVLRDQVNTMLDDGFSYKAIIQKLEQSTNPPLPYRLLEMNISRYKDNGYQDYLHDQEWRDQIRAARESASGLDDVSADTKFHENVIQIAITDIFLSLKKGDLKQDPANYTRILNSLSRLSREALVLKKYRDLCAKEQSAELKANDPNLDPERLRAIMVRAMEQALGVTASPTPIGPDINVPTNPSPTSSVTLSETSSETLSETLSQPSSQPSSEPLSQPLSETSSATLSQTSSEPPPTTEPQPSNPIAPSDSTIQPTQPSNDSTPPPEPDSAIQPSNDSPPPPKTDSTIQPLNDSTFPKEHCLECYQPLPPLRPDGGRPSVRCENCISRLPPPGTCALPSIEECPSCRARLPRVLPNGQRPTYYCHKCETPLPDPVPPPDP